ncbi:MAG: hypothetical protein RLZZ393_602 [Pseudomonadota bacterium]|jgi:uncharacterized DUF497 family protein
MDQPFFEWDDSKNRSNKAKHGVAFEEAQGTFFDENARLILDDDHSDAEDRFVLIGFSLQLRLLVVCHCYRQAEHVVRIISARRATTQEKRLYMSYLP